MAIKYFTGFEADTTILAADGVVLANTPTITTSQRHRTISGRGGARSIECNAAADTVSIPAFSAGVAEEIGLAVYFAVGGSWQVQFLQTTENCSVRMAVDGFVRIHRGAGTVLATSALVLPADSWTWLKIKVTAREAASAGRVQVYINGDSTPFVDTGAGVDCRGTSTDDFTTVLLAGSSAGTYFDDYVQASSGSLPDEALYVQSKRPVAESGTPDGIPSTGTDNSATIDEDPVSTADYNELTAAGQEDRFTFGALGFTPLAVLAVRTLAHMTGEGTLTLGRGLFQSGGSTTYGTNKAVQTGGLYGIIGDVFELDPNGAIALTGAAVDAGIFGYEAN